MHMHLLQWVLLLTDLVGVPEVHGCMGSAQAHIQEYMVGVVTTFALTWILCWANIMQNEMTYCTPPSCMPANAAHSTVYRASNCCSLSVNAQIPTRSQQCFCAFLQGRHQWKCWPDAERCLWINGNTDSWRCGGEFWSIQQAAGQKTAAIVVASDFNVHINQVLSSCGKLCFRQTLGLDSCRLNLRCWVWCSLWVSWKSFMEVIASLNGAYGLLTVSVQAACVALDAMHRECMYAMHWTKLVARR